MSRLVRWLLVVVCGVALHSCAHTLRGANPDVGVELPADHAAHGDAQTEWWHFHGHVVDDQGRRYDWFLGFVKQHTDLDRVMLLPVRWFVDPMEVAYFTVTERSADRFHMREKHAFPDTWAASTSQDRLALRHDSWTADMDADGNLTLSARTLNAKMKMKLRALKPAALLGDNGYLHFPPKSSHYYYSIPRMSAQGTITIDGDERAVTGLGWLKHEWGFLYSEKVQGWVWFGVQLSSGQELEIGLVFDKGWNMLEGSFGVIEEKDGTVTKIQLPQMEVRETGEIWRSSRTGTVYPVGWLLDIPGRGTLTLTAPVKGQEMIVFPANLWAGGLEVEGVFDDVPVTGDCFTEVVGLDEPFGRSLLRTGRPDKWQMVKKRKGGSGDGSTEPPRSWPVVDTVAPAVDNPLPAAEGPAPTADDVAAAADIYRLRCAPCHGETGRADGAAASRLDPPPRDFTSADWQGTVTDRQIETAIVKGGAAIGRSPVMPANPDLAGRPEVVRALRARLRDFAVRDFAQ